MELAIADTATICAPGTTVIEDSRPGPAPAGVSSAPSLSRDCLPNQEAVFARYRALNALWDAAPVYAGESGAAAAPQAGGEADSAAGAGDADGKKRKLNPITNAKTELVDKVPKTVPLTMTEILNTIHENTDGWPRKVGKTLFIHEPNSGGISYLDSTDALFGWLSSMSSHRGVIEWHKSLGCVTMPMVFKEVRRKATEYAATELLPHEPPLPGHYYACHRPEPTNGDAISRLVSRFNWKEEADRQLILAMFATTIWGGRGGSRPTFVIDSDDGRGVGKTKLTDMLSHLVGGHIELEQHAEAEAIKKRLLSTEAAHKRLVRLDNVKSLRLSWSDLESMITATQIGGHRLYEGEGTRPNNFTWVITFNSASLSTDMAQRSVVIKVQRPPADPNWENDTIRFIDENRDAIIGDLIQFLQSPKQPLSEHSRWAAWESEVLSRLPDPAMVQRVIAMRSSATDVEHEEAAIFEEGIAKRLSNAGYYPDSDRVHILNSILVLWYGEIMNEKKTTRGVAGFLRQAAKEGMVKRLAENPSRKHGRGFVWTGSEAEPGAGIDYDLDDRLELNKRRDGGLARGRSWD